VRGLRSCPGFLATLALAFLPAPAGAQAVGSEFQVNAFTTSNQGTRSSGSHLIAPNAGEGFVVVWHSLGQDGNSFGIFGQRYDSEGNALGGEFRVNSDTAGSQFGPSVASDTSGNFVVVWSGADGFQSGIFGQRYDSQGVALGGEFRVNTFTTGNQGGPSVASDAAGNSVVVWEGEGQGDSDSGIFGQRYDSGGMARGSEFRVNSFTTGSQIVSSVASDANGNFVMVWISTMQDGSDWGIFGQRFDSEETR
jgi:hypothetical protein